jgi:hypothetical protein
VAHCLPLLLLWMLLLLLKGGVQLLVDSPGLCVRAQAQ